MNLPPRSIRRLQNSKYQVSIILAWIFPKISEAQLALLWTELRPVVSHFPEFPLTHLGWPPNWIRFSRLGYTLIMAVTRSLSRPNNGNLSKPTKTTRISMVLFFQAPSLLPGIVDPLASLTKHLADWNPGDLSKALLWLKSLLSRFTAKMMVE